MRNLILVLVVSFLIACTPKTYISKSYNFNNMHRIGILAFNSPNDAFKGAENLFAKSLLKYGYTVVERAQIEKVLLEHDLSVDSYLSPDITRKLGKTLGVDVLLLGEITSYLPEQKTLAYNVSKRTTSEPVYRNEIKTGPEGEVTVTQHYAGQQYRDEKNVYPSEYVLYAQVGVVAKMIDVNTAEVIWVGDDTTEGVSGLDAISSSANGLIKSFDKAVRKVKKQK